MKCPGTAPIAPAAVGELIGEYRIRAQLGVGGMGIVYEAQRLAEEPVALKLLLPDRLADDRAVRRFHDEAIAGSVVHHQNVAATLDHGETTAGIPFLVMERVCGEPLGAKIHREGRLSLRRAVEIAQQILAGLEALHTAGVVHGDVKSDNVLVEAAPDGEERVHLIDFGLAHVQFYPGDVRRPDPEDELVSGTPEYMAPEVIRGEGSSVASDIYAVGVILYELITGNTPFGDGAPTEIVQRHLADRVVPPSLRRPDAPAILERIVLRALEKDPAKRFASARAFASALAVTLPLLEDAPVQAAPTASRDTPTLEWCLQEKPKRRRAARGTPRYGSRH